jgi:putative ABC transport system permease protein
MKTKKMLSTAWANLKSRKLRTTLTTLSVVIGITTIIALASLGEGFRATVKQRMEQGFELDMLIVFPGSFTAGFRNPFNQTDVNKIKPVQNVTLATPLITIPIDELYKTVNHEKIGAFTVGAINFTEMQQMIPKRFQLMDGHFPTANENMSIVLGYKAATRNGTLTVNVGENVTAKMELTYGGSTYTLNFNFTVAGILEEGGTSGITNFDYWAFIPLSTAVKDLRIGEQYQIILVKVSDPKWAEQVAKAIENEFPPYSISIFVPTSFLQQVDRILNIVQMFLLAIASVSLLVAGVGIMNIMTVSVMERTREIGILKAIGARSRTVLAMFLAETMLIGVVGGVIGIFSGYGFSYGLAYIVSGFMQPSQQSTGPFQAPDTETMTITPAFSPEWTIIAFVFAIIVCIIFGLYPARKAAKLDPVHALRYE